MFSNQSKIAFWMGNCDLFFGTSVVPLPNFIEIFEATETTIFFQKILMDIFMMFSDNL